eukprot:989501-Pelagomonas_calceolata.AAC.1
MTGVERRKESCGCGNVQPQAGLAGAPSSLAACCMHGFWTDALSWCGAAGFLLQALGELTHSWGPSLAGLTELKQDNNRLHTLVTADSGHDSIREGKGLKSKQVPCANAYLVKVQISEALVHQHAMQSRQQQQQQQLSSKLHTHQKQIKVASNAFSHGGRCVTMNRGCCYIVVV